MAISSLSPEEIKKFQDEGGNRKFPGNPWAPGILPPDVLSKKYQQGEEDKLRKRLLDAPHFKDEENYTSNPGDIISLSLKRDISDHPEWVKLGTIKDKVYYQDVGRQVSSKYQWITPVAILGGAIIGSIIPVFGTVVGASVGAALGAGVGAGIQSSAEGAGFKAAAEEGARGLGKGALMAGAAVATGGASAAVQGAAVAGASALGTAVDVKTRGGGTFEGAFEEGIRAGVVTRAGMMGPEIGAGAAGLSAYTRRGGTAEDALKAAAMSEATGRGVAWASGKGQPGFMGTYSRQNPWQDLTGSTYFNPTTGTGGLDYMTLRPFNNQRMASTFDMGVDPFSQYGVQTPFGAGGVASRIGEMNTPALPSVPRYSWWDRIGKVGPALQGFAGLAGAVSDIYGTVVQKKLSEDNLSAWREAQRAENEWHLAQIENEKRKLEIEQKRYEQDYELGKRKLTFEEARTSPVTTEPFVMPNF